MTEEKVCGSNDPQPVASEVLKKMQNALSEFHNFCRPNLLGKPKHFSIIELIRSPLCFSA